MHAIVKRSRAPGLTVTTVPKPSPGPGEVLIAVRHAGMCGTDLHIADWNAWAQQRINPPLVIGHEFAGEVVAVGDRVAEITPGQLVTAEGHIVCGHCLQCRTGNSHICRRTQIIGVDRDGAFADYIVMPATNVLPLDGIPTDIGAIMDPMGNAFHAVLTAEIPGSVVLVVGCGPIGCFAVGIARAAGAAKVIASDINPKRLALAERMGAHVIIDAGREDVTRRVLEETNREGADVVCEMSGVPSALHQAFASVRMGGRVQLLGIPTGRGADRLCQRDHLQGAHPLRRHRAQDVRDLASDAALFERRPVRPASGRDAPVPPRPRRRRHRRHPRRRCGQDHPGDRMTFPARLQAELDQFRHDGVYKRLNYLASPQGARVRMEGRGEVLILSSNNYLGLCDAPDVVAAGKRALDEFGAGTGSVRFICGTFTIHRELEAALARLVGCAAALSYVSCWNANEGLCATLLGEQDIVISDQLNHASIIDSIRLAKSITRCQSAVYRHSDMGDLEDKLRAAKDCRLKLIMTDGVFSMEGDIARLPDIIGTVATV